MLARFVSVILSICMLITSAPFTNVVEKIDNAFDEVTAKKTETVEQTEKEFVVTENSTSVWDGSTVTEPALNGTTYTIDSAADLAWVAQNVNAGTSADNRFTGYTLNLTVDIDLANYEWTPIGGNGASSYFNGTFNGNGHKISGLEINSSEYNVGLFGHTYTNAVIKNLGIIDPSIIWTCSSTSTTYGAGALIGRAQGTDVDSCYVRGGEVFVTQAISGGGLIGCTSSSISNVTNCYVQGTIVTVSGVATNSSAGGICGYAALGTDVFKNCYSTAVATKTANTTDNAGAIVGRPGADVDVINCYGVSVTASETTPNANTLIGEYHSTYHDGISGGGMVDAATLKTYANATDTYLNANGRYFYRDHSVINSGYPVLAADYDYIDLQNLIDSAKRINNETAMNYSAILKYQPELIDNLNLTIEAAQNYLAGNPTVAGVWNYTSELETAIRAFQHADAYYIDNTGSLEALNITVSAPPVLTMAEDGTYDTATIKVKSNYLITNRLTLVGSNNVELELVDGYNVEKNEYGKTEYYIYTYNITGGIPETVTNTTVIFNATANANGQTVTASATTSTFLTGVNKVSFQVNIEGQYNREDWFGSIETKTYLKNHYAIVGLHGYTDPAKTDFSYDYGTDDGEDSSITYGTESSPTAIGATGYFYHDKNNSNKLGVATGSTKTSSVGVAFIPERDDSYQRFEQAKLSADLTSYLTEKTVNTHGADETQYVYNLNVDSGQDDTITYTVYFMVEANDESTNTIHNYSQFSVDIIQVDTTALWNLYNSEANKIGRFDYKDLYEQANPEAWAAYETAYINAAQVLQGGVSQETIDAAFEQFLAAVLGLGTVIKYDLNGGEGTIPEPQNVPIYRDVTVSSTNVEDPIYYLNDVYLTELAPYDGITRTGYQCLGWSLKKDVTQNDMLSGYLKLPNGAMYKAVTLYAAWSPNTYTIKYKANAEGSVAGIPADQQATYDVVSTLSAQVPQLPNRDFIGWNTRADGKGYMYEAGAEVNNLIALNGGIVILYAQWTDASPEIRFFINLPEGVTETTSGPKEDFTEILTIGTDADLTPFDMEASGWRHIGWSTQAVAITPQYTTEFNVPQTATNLYAVWQKKAMTVLYNTNFGELLDGGAYTPVNTSVNCGDTVKLPTKDEVYKAGYTLAGWKSSIDGQFYQESYIIPDSTETVVTFTAEWIKRQTTITLHHNNNELEDVTTEIKGEYDSALAPEEFITPEAMEGYTFIGWFERTENGYTEYAKPSTSPSDDIDLYAGWSMDALSAELQRFPTDIDNTAIYPSTGETLYYYQDPGRTNAKTELTQANSIFDANIGMLYDYTEITETNFAIAELKTAIDALIETPADYTVVDQYRTYYYEMTLNVPNDEYNDTHTFNYNGVEYQVTKDIFTEDTFKAFEDAVDAVVNGKGIRNQAYVDGCAAVLIEAYNNLIPKPADYTDYDYYMNEALMLNTIIETGETSLDELYSDTYGMLWYEEDSWTAFFDLSRHYNSVVLRDLTLLDQKKIDSANYGLKECYSMMQLKPADYTAVETAITMVPADLSFYTDETVSVLNVALNAVVYGLNITDQPIVDGYAEAIEKAVDALELKVVVDLPKYEMSTATDLAGTEVEIYVSIKNNPGIISVRNSISYDTSALELLKVENLGLLGGFTNPAPMISSPYILRWADSLASENNTADGQFVKLTFKIKEDAAVGEYEISVNPIESRNFNGEKITFEAATSSITVIDYIVGDIDNDGEVTDWDSIILNRYLAGWDVTIDILESADIDRDGEITDWDSIMLERYLAGWDIPYIK